MSHQAVVDKRPTADSVLRSFAADGPSESVGSTLWPKVVVFEGDARQAEQLVTHMASHALDGTELNSGGAIRDAHSRTPFDAIVIDIGAEAEDPLDLIRQFTGLKTAPGIIVYSTIANEVDRVVALELGSDDVIPKSCGYRELVARIKSGLRRRKAETAHLAKLTAPAAVAKYKFDGWSIDLPAKTVLTPLGGTVLLSRLEFMIFSTLFEEPAVVHSRAELARLIAHADKGEALRVINVLIGSIRKKTTADGSVDIIVNRRGIGYHLSALNIAH